MTSKDKNIAITKTKEEPSFVYICERLSLVIHDELSVSVMKGKIILKLY